MSELSTPPASAPPPPDSAPPAETSRRAHTVLGRLAAAVREQNWFAVALEVVIVVLGVVIGFQVTAWGQGRSDRAKEQAYLLQLEGDLVGTLADLDWVDRAMAKREVASTKLLHGFQLREPPPRDSLLVWLDEVSGSVTRSPVTRTIDAMIATGDLRLLRNDSLRLGLPEYAEFVEVMEGLLSGSDAASGSARRDLLRHVDPVEIHRIGVERGRWRDGFWKRVPDPFPDEQSSTVLPFDAPSFLKDEEAYRSAYAAFRSLHYMKMNRLDIRRETEEMLRRVRSELGARYGTEPTTRRHP